MSEEGWKLSEEELLGNKKQKEKAVGITVKVEKGHEIKALEKQLEEKEEELEDYKNRFELVADKEFERKREEIAQKIGIAPEEIEDAPSLKAFEKIAEKQSQKGDKKTPSGGIPLTGAQYYDAGRTHDIETPLFDRIYDSEQEMLADLENTAKNAKNNYLRHDAQKTLAEFYKKTFSELDKGAVAQFEGDLTKLVRGTPEERKEESKKWRIKK